MNDLELLRDADPAAGPLPRTDRAAMLAGLRRATTESTAPEPLFRSHKQRSGMHRRPRARLVASAAVLLVVVAGTVTWQVAGAGRPGGASPAAAAALGQAAAAAIGAKDPVLSPGQYLKITSKEVASVTTDGAPSGLLTWLDQSTREVWMPADPSRDWAQRRSNAPYKFFHPQDERIARDNGLLAATGPDELLHARDGEFYGPQPATWQSPTKAFLAGLPRDPQRLLKRVYHDSKDSGPSADGEALVTIADVLRSGLVPADLRAALFQAATGIPGVVVTDRQANLDGRTGVAVGRDERSDGNAFRQELIFDAGTGQVIGERQVVLDGQNSGVPIGEVSQFSSVTTTIVDDAP